MSKLVLIPKNKTEINKYVEYYILGLKDYSINMPGYFSLGEIKQISKKQKVFVSINKNIHNNELENLKKILLSLNQVNIEGILFYDIAIVNLKNKLNIKHKLIWNQEHLTNNYQTINYWYKKGINGTYLSSELTKREIIEIRQNTKSKLFMNIFGYLPIFTSRRPLITNYLDTFELKKEKNYIIKKENKKYHIEEEKTGTTIYSDYILNIKKEYQELKNIIDYFVINSYMIDNIEEVVKDFENNKYKEETGFLYRETIYKVK